MAVITGRGWMRYTYPRPAVFSPRREAREKDWPPPPPLFDADAVLVGDKLDFNVTLEPVASPKRDGNRYLAFFRNTHESYLLSLTFLLIMFNF
jgi:hypothetical protein